MCNLPIKQKDYLQALMLLIPSRISLGFFSLKLKLYNSICSFLNAILIVAKQGLQPVCNLKHEIIWVETLETKLIKGYVKF